MDELPIDQLFCGDAVELSRDKLPDASIDGIATDPPYGLEFMGEEWDTFQEKGQGKGWQIAGKPSLEKFDGRNDWHSKSRPAFRGHTIEHWRNYQEWTTSWAKEALRVLKPGASMLVMGGTRTYHRMACGVEDAGFVIKDCLAWCYNSGFPKAQDLGKMIDKRAPRRGMFTKFAKHYGERRNVKGLTHNAICEHGKFYAEYNHGGASVNWEAGYNVPTLAQWNILQPLLGLSEDFLPLIQRVEVERKIIGKETNKICFENLGSAGYKGEWNLTSPATALAKKWDGWKVGGLKPAYEPVLWAVKPPEGSYIDNVLKHGVGAINVDGCRIEVPQNDFKGKGGGGIHRIGEEIDNKIYGKGYIRTDIEHKKDRYPSNMIRTDRFHDGYDRFYFVPKASRAERDEGLEGLPLKELKTHGEMNPDTTGQSHNTTGQQPAKAKNTHPTVKPVRLGEYLIKLVTRPGQIIVDFFCGSGSFLIAARRQNRHYIGFDNNPEYIEIARHRLAAIPKSLEAYSERIEVK